MILILTDSALTRRVDPTLVFKPRRPASHVAAASASTSGRVARALRLPPVARTGSAPGGCNVPRALAETRREFGRDYKEGAAVWYAVVAGAD